MLIKIKKGQVEEYPYSFWKLRYEHPNTSFPQKPSLEFLASFGVYEVLRVPRPDANNLTENVSEGVPELVEGVWQQSWVVSPATIQEVAERKVKKNAQIEEARHNEYKSYSDPLFFQWQRGEIEKQEWLDSVSRIKELLPYVD